MSRLCSQIVVFLVLLLGTICTYGSNSTWSTENKIRCKEAERQALLNIKRDLQFWEVPDLLSSWGNEEGETDCCKWLGVGCANDSGHVISLDLSSISTLGINDYVLNWIVGGKINPSLFELRYLNYLDLSFIQFMGSRIPSSIGTLGHLRYLNLSYTFMGGEIPPQLANLSNLQVLDLGYNHYTINSLKWLSHLSSLIDLRLNGLNLSKAYDWVQIVNQLPGLTTLELGYCNLRDVVIPPSFSSVNSSASSLSILNLSNNNLSVSVFSWLFNFSNSLVHLDLSVNQLEGSVPESFGKMTALKFLDLSRNDKLSGSIPEAFSKMTALKYLDLSRDKFKGSIPEIFVNISALEYLDLGDNMLEGELPKSIWNLSMLRTLRIASNNLSGNLPQTSFQKLKQLERLDISRNSLGGVISEAGFSELSELHYLDLSFNSLALNFHSEWIPPFRLRNIFLGSCKLGPQFPKWLRTQKNYSFLDISNSGISDSIPNWFWNLSNGFQSMNLSNNQLNGELGNISLDWHEELLYDNLDIDLSSNQLEGVVPSFLFKVAAVDLSRNRFSKLNVPCNISGHTALKFLDISYNELSGELPDCWSRLKELRVLNLAKNKLAGKIPPSVGSLTEIETLRLTGNNFFGELPASLKNCTQLSVIDFGGNKLTGPIPTWIGENLHLLIILSMRSNYFSGSIPSHLCHLTYLQLLDLSLNDISGSIAKCICNFTAMRKGWEDDRTTITHSYATHKSSSDGVFFGQEYEDDVQLQWKGNLMEFKSILRLVKSIDLSSNRLTGEIPTEIVKLDGLVSLNLSRNNLHGQIPHEIGQLTSLDVLDLSRNNLLGEIPRSLTQIDRLSTLDLSNNNLSGKIPTSTQLQSFPSTAFMGNPELCGPPLSIKCPNDDQEQPVSRGTAQEADELLSGGFYISMAIGFVVAFWGVCGTLIFNRSFRYAYFNLLNDVGDFFWVMTAIYKAKLLRMIKS